MKGLKEHHIGRELTGSIGDIGVLFPLAAALIVTGGLKAGTVLLTTGAIYLAAGLYYRVPVPVQPLKAMAAIAIAGSVGADELAAGGIIMGLILLAVGYSGLASHLSRIFEPWVVKGVQLAVGLLLFKAGVHLITGKDAWGGASPAPQIALVSVLAAVAVALLFLVISEKKRIPMAIAIIFLGFLAGMLINGWSLLPQVSFGPDLPVPALPSTAGFISALFLLVLPQLPVTFGNSVVATADAAQVYFGPSARRVTPKALCASIGISDLLLGLLGSMPICHGSGGMTAHYRMGARSGWAVVAMGLFLIIPALLLGNSAVILLLLFPLPLLGMLTIYVGLEHARLMTSLKESRVAFGMALIMGLVSLLWNNIALGLAVGLAASLMAKTPFYIKRLVTR